MQYRNIKNIYSDSTSLYILGGLLNKSHIGITVGILHKFLSQARKIISNLSVASRGLAPIPTLNLWDWDSIFARHYPEEVSCLYKAIWPFKKGLFGNTITNYESRFLMLYIWSPVGSCIYFSDYTEYRAIFKKKLRYMDVYTENRYIDSYNYTYINTHLIYHADWKKQTFSLTKFTSTILNPVEF